MKIANTLSTLSLALALFGGALVIAPTKVEAANNGHISYGALNPNKVNQSVLRPGNSRPGQPVNKYTRGCSKINMCRG